MCQLVKQGDDFRIARAWLVTAVKKIRNAEFFAAGCLARPLWRPLKSPFPNRICELVVGGVSVGPLGQECLGLRSVFVGRSLEINRVSPRDQQRLVSSFVSFAGWIELAKQSELVLASCAASFRGISAAFALLFAPATSDGRIRADKSWFLQKILLAPNVWCSVLCL